MPGLVLGSPVVLPGTYGQPTSGETDKQTLGDLRLKLKKGLGNRDDLTDTDLNGYLGDALSEMSSEIKFDELRGSLRFSTVVGNNQYYLPTGVNTLIDVTVASGLFYFAGRILQKTDRQAFDRLPDVSGWPVSFFREARTLVLWPTPNAAVDCTVSFSIRHQRLVLDSDQLLLDPQWEVPLVTRARAIAFPLLGDPDLGAQALNEYLASVRSKISKISEERIGTTSTVSVPRKSTDVYMETICDGDDW